MNDREAVQFSKVPEVTLGFWIIKILATTLGETGGDAVTMSMKSRLRPRHADFPRRLCRGGRGPDPGGALQRLSLLAHHRRDHNSRDDDRGFRGSLARHRIFRRIGHPVDRPDAVARRLALVRGNGFREHGYDAEKFEAFYWVTILFSQTLGTALGDWVADTNDLGYAGGAVVFGAAIVVIAALYAFTQVSRVGLFWAAFILTRPLGATLGDLLDKPLTNGGFAISRYEASAILAALIVVLVAALPKRAGVHPGSRASQAASGGLSTR